MKKKGFTLVELLVVIAIIALLMGILMPALSKVRQIAYRVICGSNLAGIGKSMLVYAQDNEEWYPVGGARGSAWKPGVKWEAADRSTAYGITNPPPTGGGIQTAQFGSIASSFYLLVKYTDAQPKLFICKGDEGSKVFTPIEAGTNGNADKDLTYFWGFGDETGNSPAAAKYYSYCYQLPFYFGNAVRYNITAASPGNTPVAADRNPYFDSNTKLWRDGAVNVTPALAKPKWSTNTPDQGTLEDQDRYGNAAAHQRDGQNVLFQDTHVEFARLPNVGINKDHIYKIWGAMAAAAKQQDKELGKLSTSAGSLQQTTYTQTYNIPAAKEDSYLVNEPN